MEMETFFVFVLLLLLLLFGNVVVADVADVAVAVVVAGAVDDVAVVVVMAIVMKSWCWCDGSEELGRCNFHLGEFPAANCNFFVAPMFLKAMLILTLILKATMDGVF